VDLDEHIPLRYILEQTAIQIDMKPLDRSIWGGGGLGLALSGIIAYKKLLLDT